MGDNSNFKIFSKENRVKLTETLNLEKCSLLSKFGNTKVIERFIGTQGADFSITYNIEKNHCYHYRCTDTCTIVPRFYKYPRVFQKLLKNQDRCG